MLRRLCAAFVLAVLGACPTSPATVDAGAVDGGAAAVVDAVVVDAGVVDAGVVDAGAVDAGLMVDAGEVPTVDAIVDAGTMADVSPPSPPSPPTATATPDRTHPVSGFIHDRLLVKPKDAALSAANLERMVEKQLGAKVKLVRRTAGTFWLVQLEPTRPPRTKQDQAKAVARLQKSGTFASVEGDQLMTIKAGFGPVSTPMVHR
jgi:hypothetical protein